MRDNRVSSRTWDGKQSSHRDFIETLRQKIAGVLQPLLKIDRAVALLDFPNHSNVGDSAIWLGEVEWLQSLGVRRLSYSCDIRTYFKESLSRQIGDGTILLSGGGNLGDLWIDTQEFREQVISSFPKNRIIQLPQSIYFQDRSLLNRAREVFDRHPDLIILVRDERSLEIARKEFHTPSFLCPDMAFYLGPLRRPTPVADDVIWLARTDKESAVSAISNESRGVSRVDWLEEPRTPLVRMNYLLSYQLRLHNGKPAVVSKAVSMTYHPLARQRLARGCRLLGRGKTVISDRLHGHILSLLLGIPHILLDNSYGKVRNFYSTWTSDCDLCTGARLHTRPLIWHATFRCLSCATENQQFSRISSMRKREDRDQKANQFYDNLWMGRPWVYVFKVFWRFCVVD